jgi:hypothetical protein
VYRSGFNRCLPYIGGGLNTQVYRWGVGMGMGMCGCVGMGMEVGLIHRFNVEEGGLIHNFNNIVYKYQCGT